MLDSVIAYHSVGMLVGLFVLAFGIIAWVTKRENKRDKTELLRRREEDEQHTVSKPDRRTARHHKPPRAFGDTN